MTNAEFEVNVRKIEHMTKTMSDGQLAEIAKIALCNILDQHEIPEETWAYLDALTDAELIG